MNAFAACPAQILDSFVEGERGSEGSAGSASALSPTSSPSSAKGPLLEALLSRSLSHPHIVSRSQSRCWVTSRTCLSKAACAGRVLRAGS